MLPPGHIFLSFAIAVRNSAHVIGVPIRSSQAAFHRATKRNPRIGSSALTVLMPSSAMSEPTHFCILRKGLDRNGGPPYAAGAAGAEGATLPAT